MRNTSRKTISNETVIKVHQYLIENKKATIDEVAKKFDVSRATVSRIKRQEGRYKDIIMNYITEQLAKKRKPKKVAKTPGKSKTLTELSDQEIHEQAVEDAFSAKMKILNYDIFVGDIIAVLQSTYTPLMIKLIIDNFIEPEPYKELILKTIEEIKKVKTKDFYTKALKTFITGIYVRTLTENALKKIYS